jgi:hypothetical protein
MHLDFLVSQILRQELVVFVCTEIALDCTETVFCALWHSPSRNESPHCLCEFQYTGRSKTTKAFMRFEVIKF